VERCCSAHVLHGKLTHYRDVARRPGRYRPHHRVGHQVRLDVHHLFAIRILRGGHVVDDLRQVRRRRPAGRLRQVAARQPLHRRRRRLNALLDGAAGSPLLLRRLIAVRRRQLLVIACPLFLRRAFARLFNLFRGQLRLTGIRGPYLPLRPGDIRRLVANLTNQLRLLQLILFLLLFKSREEHLINVLYYASQMLI